MMKWLNNLFTKREKDSPLQQAMDMQCPVCGYYCLGKGGRGCIDKVGMVDLANENQTSGQSIADEAKHKLGIRE